MGSLSTAAHWAGGGGEERGGGGGRGGREGEGALVLLGEASMDRRTRGRKDGRLGVPDQGAPGRCGDRRRPGPAQGVGRDAGRWGRGTGASGGGGTWAGEVPASEMAAQVARGQARPRNPRPVQEPGPCGDLTHLLTCQARRHRLSLPHGWEPEPGVGVGFQATERMNNAAAEIGR